MQFKGDLLHDYNKLHKQKGQSVLRRKIKTLLNKI